MNYRRSNSWTRYLPFGSTPYPWTLRIVVLNALVFLLQLLLEPTPAGYYIRKYFYLWPQLVLTQGFVWQLGSYMFMHAGFIHIGFNMFLLWMMGREVEYTLGGPAFLRLYFLSGLMAGIASLFMLFMGPGVSVIGASGAVLGILAAYGRLFPDRMILAFFFIPMKVKHFIWVIAVIDLYGAVAGRGGNIAHLAHIGGLFTGLLLMRTGWYRRPIFSLEQWRLRRERETLRRDRERVNQILAKVSREGIGSLSRSEREFLERMRKGH